MLNRILQILSNGTLAHLVHSVEWPASPKFVHPVLGEKEAVYKNGQCLGTLDFLIP